MQQLFWLQAGEVCDVCFSTLSWNFWWRLYSLQQFLIPIELVLLSSTFPIQADPTKQSESKSNAIFNKRWISFMQLSALKEGN